MQDRELTDTELEAVVAGKAVANKGTPKSERGALSFAVAKKTSPISAPATSSGCAGGKCSI